MNRRQFLKIAFVGISSYALSRLIVPGFNADAAGQSANLFQLLGGYASRVGASTTDTLSTSTQARESREYFNGVMMDSGYTLRPDGSQIVDTTDLTDLPRSDKFRRSTTEFYGLGSEFRSPYNINILIPDICVPLHLNNYNPDSGVVLFEGPAVIGTAMGTAQYLYEKPRSTPQHIADIFFPTEPLQQSPPGLDGTLVTTTPFTESYGTRNGDVVITYIPPVRSNPASVIIDASGTTNFTNHYDFTF